MKQKKYADLEISKRNKTESTKIIFLKSPTEKLLLIIITAGNMVALHNLSFSVTSFSFPIQEVYLLQKLLFMELELPHGYS